MPKRLRIELALVALALSGSSFADLTLEFQGVTKKRVWVAASGYAPSDEIFQMDSPDGQNRLVIPGDRLTKGKVCVLDLDRNLMVVRPARSDSKPWAISAKTFDRVGETAIEVRGETGPLLAGTVTLKAKSGEDFTAILGPKDEGVARVWGVPLGAVTVGLTYKKSGATAELNPAPNFTLEAAAASGLRLNVLAAGADDVPTKAESSSDPAKPAANEAKKAGPMAGAQPAGFMSFLAYVGGLCVAIGALYFAFRWVQNNREQVNQRLEKMGVAIPEDLQADSGDPDPAPVPKAPEPIQPIVLDAAAPDLVVAAPAAVARPPRLVGPNGMVRDLAEGSVILGRDSGADWALTEESSLSRRHAEITFSGGGLSVRDLGSTNGTFVDGTKLGDQPAEIRPGSVIQFGALSFRYEA